VTNHNEALRGNSRRSVYRLVEDHAAVRPNAIAITAGDRTISYKELNDRSAALAAELRGSGIGRDVVVGICIKSSIAMIVGALGVLKAGGAYLPLDPTFPVQRLNHILQDAKISVLLTTHQNPSSTASGSWKVLELDENGGLSGTVPAAGNSSTATATSSNDLAYVIYTSGSTGEPKGVEIEHGSLLNLIDWHQRTFSITPEDRASQIAGPGFDAAVWEIWPYLTAGASIHIPDDALRTQPSALRDWLVKQQITVSFMPTAIVERIIALDWPKETRLRTVLTGADTLHRFPPAGLPFELVNNYGPTECTVVATSGTVPAMSQTNERPTIGQAITNTRVYILDDHLKAVKAGLPGEMYIGGAGVARGYRNHPQLTAARFVHDPFVHDKGARMYRTGDLARFREDGQIVFLGRVDDQIKIRGFRIEPDEITAALDRHPGISQSAVIAREFSEGEQRLVAYLVPQEQANLTRSELQTFLSTHLPEYMIPSVFVKLDELPLTANGKIDRDRLPKPEAHNTIADGSVEQPRSVVEERVTALLSELLEIKHIGIRDNFFHLGGHSLLGAQVIARVRDVFEVELSLRTIFDNPTVEGISAEIERLILIKLEQHELQRTAA
jgi:amino acid adenylation domain-containing protein